MASLLAFGVGVPELFLIAFIIVLLFGSTKIPALMRGMGQGIGELKKGMREGEPTGDKTPPAP